MDPKALSHLDPKQREAYERVMGTAAQIHGDSSVADPTATPMSVDQTPVTSDTSSFTSGSNDFITSATPTPDLSSQAPLSDGTQLNTPPVSFETNVTGLSSSPLGDMPSGLDPLNPTGTTNASPSIFTTPPTEPASDFSTGLAAAPNSSFFTNPTPDSSDLSAPAEPTIASDNLSSITPVTPYPDATTETTTPQPFSDPLPSPAEVTQANAPHETSALLKVLYIVGAVVFFAIYTIFWVKVFNLPFLF